MTYQVATLKYRGLWKIIHTDEKTYNPFEVYYIYHNKDGRHKHKVTEYEDLNSAMYVLAEVVKNSYGYSDVKALYGWKKPVDRRRKKEV